MGNRYVILSRGVSSILDTSRDFLIRGHGMNECSKRRNPFVPVLVIRFGQVELELSNAVSSELLSQVKELMHLVE